MAIRNLTPAAMTAFTGKNTNQNLADATPGTFLSAKNVMVLADNQIRRAPGYTQVVNTGVGPVRATYDFERNVDGRKFVFVQSAGFLFYMNADGSGFVQISNGETAAPFEFVQNAFICYASNGVNAYRFVDVNGTLTKYKWGMDPSASAPTISLSPGTLTLAFGRRYVYCPVSKYTDSLGIERVSVGPPSPFSAHSGPVASQVVTLTNIAVFTDPQVNFKWIFETSDSPVDTSSTFFFAAEITNGTTSYGDTLLDTDLDQTRLAPFDNNPAPPAAILTTFQNRVVAVTKTQMRLSGFSEINLGIPEEAWPLSLFFNIPAGSRLATSAIVTSDGTTLTVDTVEAKYGYTGYDASTFTEQDRIATPGAVGALAQCNTPFGIAVLSQSKRLWMWKGPGSAMTEISADISQAYPDTYGMEDLSAADLPSAKLLWYSYGKIHFLAVIARTSDAPDAFANLIQLWSIPVKGSQSSGEFTGSSSFFNQIGGLYQTDKIPSVSISSAAVVKVANVPYLYLGDATGKIYRFPDGFQDNGNPYISNLSSPWSLLGMEAEKRFYWIDLFVQSPASLLDQGGPVANFHVFAAVSESAEDVPVWIELQLSLVPNPKKPSQYAIRGNLQVDGLNTGRYIRVAVTMPNTNDDHVILKTIIWHRPMYQGAP